jgi:hypothetical protein
VVHVDNALDERQRSELVGQLRGHDGVGWVMSGMLTRGPNWLGQCNTNRT